MSYGKAGSIPKPREITATYESKCYECGEKIGVGERIFWLKDVEENASYVWHKACDRGRRA